MPNDWFGRPSARTTVDKVWLKEKRTEALGAEGILIGTISASDVPEEVAAFYKGHKVKNFRE